MIFNKIFHFVKGYVIIKVTSLYIERFLYTCASVGIKLFHIGKRNNNSVIMRIGIKDFFKVRSVCKKTRTHIRIVKKCGLPFFISKLKKRYFLILGFIAVICFMFTSSLFIWSIEIDGESKETAEQISLALEDAGLRIGAFKPLLPDGEQMKNIIMSNTDNLVWAWVNIKGTKAFVEYNEGIKPPKVVNRSIPCDIVAQRDGIIYKITEKNGEKRVLTGDTVMKGDVLIAGTLTSADSTLKTVHSIGEVLACTHHKKSREYKLSYDFATPTGKSKTFRTLKLFSKCFDLFFREKVDFKEYRVTETLNELKLGKNHYLGIGIYEQHYNEIEIVNIPIDYDTAIQKAQYELEEAIAKELLPGSVLVNKKTNHQKIDDNTVLVSVEMEFIENIGVQKEIVG